MKLGIVLVVAIIGIALITSVPLTHTFAKSKKDSKARDAIIKAMGKVVEGKFSTIKLVIISKSNVTGFVVAYNTTKPNPNPPPVPPEPPVCNRNDHLENGTCVPDTIPTTGNVSKVCLVGDLKGTTVPNLMNKTGCDVKVGLGDLGYASDLKYFKALKFDKCVAGNHDTKEDGSSSLEKETTAYCGDSWWLTIANGTAVIIGINTNGDTAKQLQTVKTVLSKSPVINTIIIVSHKAGHVPPNSHHPAEAKALYANIEKLIPSNVKLIEVYGHNHVSSSAPSKNWYQAGAGGKSHYECGTDSTWTFCDNKSWGYLELTVDNNNGATAAKFIK